MKHLLGFALLIMSVASFAVEVQYPSSDSNEITLQVNKATVINKVVLLQSDEEGKPALRAIFVENYSGLERIDFEYLNSQGHVIGSNTTFSNLVETKAALLSVKTGCPLSITISRKDYDVKKIVAVCDILATKDEVPCDA